MHQAESVETMFLFGQGFLPPDSKSRSWLFSLFAVASLIFGVYFISSALAGRKYNEKLSTWQIIESLHGAKSSRCKNICRPSGSEALPKGIVTETSDYKMRPLWGSAIDIAKENKLKPSMNLLALAVGIGQKETVDRIVRKFQSSNFVVMLFHYDGAVDSWREFSWSDQAIHVSAVNQTKWWFAKRFLHPSIVAEYNYIFLWDEDIGVENFNPSRYLTIVEREGLEISQPALDPVKSVVHHPITSRVPNAILHRRMYKFKGSGRCYYNSTSPPCVGWVEMMAPVFSRAAWQCTWYMIQNDLVHAWGMDKELGYCAQGDRTKNVGVVDSEYIVHLGLPTLGVFNHSKVSDTDKENAESPGASSQLGVDARPQVRQQSSDEMRVFQKRWETAERNDKCWVDPFRLLENQTPH